MRSVLVSVLLVLVALGGAGCSSLTAWLPLGKPAVAKVGETAPEINLARLEEGRPGAKLSLESLRGKPVIVNFWATWCAPCRAEFPALEAKYKEYKDSVGLVVLAVNVAEDAGPTAAQAFVSQMGATFPVLLDTEGKATAAYNIQGLPTSIMIGRDGVVKDIVLGGPLTADYIEKELAKIR